MNKKDKLRQKAKLERSGNPEHRAKAKAIKKEIDAKRKEDNQLKRDSQTSLF